ncbi:hypothetical protein S23_29670 [Bradyrhizobium cosmicum]|uniref:Uncharacterized protein n=1 Tax=Bradyrhizobium cosmicum TaxID=1404864 RepID=A0AAI8MCZ9_9BRAD|nr:hypothetical protein S23_29670 [Bradyrhizobium cosmicum]
MQAIRTGFKDLPSSARRAFFMEITVPKGKLKCVQPNTNAPRTSGMYSRRLVYRSRSAG